LPKAAVPAAAEVNSETDTEHFGRPGNGAAAGRISFQLPTNARPARRLSGPKTPAFDSMWPKAPRPIRSIQSAPSQAAAAPPAIERQQNTEQGPDMAASTAVQQTIAQEPAAQNEAPQAVAAQSADAQGADAYNEPGTGRSKRNCPRVFCASDRSPNCAITSSRVSEAIFVEFRSRRDSIHYFAFTCAEQCISALRRRFFDKLSWKINMTRKHGRKK